MKIDFFGSINYSDSIIRFKTGLNFLLIQIYIFFFIKSFEKRFFWVNQLFRFDSIIRIRFDYSTKSNIFFLNHLKIDFFELINYSDSIIRIRLFELKAV